MDVKYSIRGMLVAVAVLALVCVSITNASDFVASIVFTVTVILLLAALVGAIYREGKTRAFWVGAAVFGWGMFLLIYSELSTSRTELVASELAGQLFHTMHPNRPYIDAATRQPADPNILTFQRLAYAYSVLGLALIGGLLARWCYATRDQTT